MESSNRSHKKATFEDERIHIEHDSTITETKERKSDAASRKTL